MLEQGVADKDRYVEYRAWIPELARIFLDQVTQWDTFDEAANTLFLAMGGTEEQLGEMGELSPGPITALHDAAYFTMWQDIIAEMREVWGGYQGTFRRPYAGSDD